MRIALVHTRYARGGGVEGYIAGLADRLLETGHEVHYFSRRSREVPAGLRHHPVPFLRWPEWLKHAAFGSLAAARVRRIGSGRPFDAVHGFSSTWDQDVYTDGSGAAADYDSAMAALAPTALHRAWALAAPRRLAAARIEARRCRSPRLRRVLAMSGMVRDGLLRRHPALAGKIEVLHPPVDAAAFRHSDRERLRSEVRAGARTPAASRVLLFAGNGYARKGLGLLLDALAVLPRPSWTLWVAGRDARRGRYEALALRRGVDVRFLGFRSDLPALLAAADAFAFPSRFDAFGAAALEAMAAGLPVVVSSRAGASEVIADGASGLVFGRMSGPEELAGHLLALEDPGLRERLGSAARATAEGLSWESHLEEILNVYREIRVG